MNGKRITHETLTERLDLLKSNPVEYLRLANEVVRQHPRDPNAYFSRHHAWTELGKPELALADLDRSLELERHGVTYAARGLLLHGLGRFREAIDDFNASQAMDEGDWMGCFGHLYRADCYARLGEVERALADCAMLREDHWTPGPFGLPKGSKSDVIAQIKYIAAVARQQNSKQN